jgi:hypothetical protein
MATQWIPEADRLWQQQQYQAAINQVLAVINQSKETKPPRTPGLQFVYYLFLLGDLQAAERYVAELAKHYPDDAEILENYAVVLNRRFKDVDQSIALLQRVVTLKPESLNAWDGLASGLSRVKRFEEARLAGEKALLLKDAQVSEPTPDWQLPKLSPQEYDVNRSGKDVIAFSLWGANPRYLRGALRNLLLVPDLYAGWVCRVYLDETVPLEFRSLILELGGEVMLQPVGQMLREKLCWRFQVANDLAVRRFLVRDADAVVSGREVCAVQEWLNSDRYFHVMRDWWTHTDLILAGMWGGRAGVLPDLGKLLQEYKSKAKETANIDQWFLRDRVWAYVRESCLIHDRCFRVLGARDWPSVGVESFHVGQNEAVANVEQQVRSLRPWIEKYGCLG